MDKIFETLEALVDKGIVPSFLIVGEAEQEALRDKLFELRIINDENDAFPTLVWRGYPIFLISSCEEEYCVASGYRLIE